MLLSYYSYDCTPNCRGVPCHLERRGGLWEGSYRRQASVLPQREKVFGWEESLGGTLPVFQPGLWRLQQRDSAGVFFQQRHPEALADQDSRAQPWGIFLSTDHWLHRHHFPLSQHGLDQVWTPTHLFWFFLPAACGMVMGWVVMLFLWFFWGRLAFGPTFWIFKFRSCFIYLHGKPQNSFRNGQIFRIFQIFRI